MANLDFKGVPGIQCDQVPKLEVILWFQGMVPWKFENWNLGNVIPYNLGIEFLAAVLVTSEHLVTPQPRSAIRNFNCCEKTGGG